MIKQKNKSGFALALVVIFVWIFSTLFFGLLWKIKLSNDVWLEWTKRNQAMNYASEGLELVKGYTLTESFKDRTNYWEKKIKPLEWYYRVWFENNEYIIESWNETIYQDIPISVEYVRDVYISSDGDEEKKITSTVDYGGKVKVSYQTSITHKN